MSDLLVESWHDVAVRKLRLHSPLTASDEELLRTLPGRVRTLVAGEDLIRQGDKPHLATVVLEGFVARYHTLEAGRRQYLSFHFPGDWPDAQTIFLEQMDHNVCGLGPATVVSIRHEVLRQAFVERPAVGFALWRETLIDAAIFRQAITNNASRDGLARMAHLFCELFYRAHKAGLVIDNAVALPLNQAQLGETLGMALVTVNRVLQALRRTETLEFRGGVLRVRNWSRLAVIADFEPDYLTLIEAPTA